jgi:SAM-dependent methyltransferase
VIEQFERVAAVEDTHWWFVALRELVAAQLRDHVDKGAALLDAGCGTGRMLVDLPRYRRTGVDVNPRALELARQRAPDVEWVRASIEALPFEDGAFDAVISLDVLYSADVESDKAAASELRRVLRPGGLAIVNLPAYQWLMSAHDLVARSARRYTVRRVRSLLRSAGFEDVRASYRVSLLFPIAAAHRLATRSADARTDVAEVGPALNRALLAVSLAENRLTRRGFRLPFGLSVFAAARR